YMYRQSIPTRRSSDLAENDHKEHILYQTTVPASVSEIVKEKAIHAAGVLANQMNIVGTFAIEMFVKDETVYLNEMAPRPHNSGRSEEHTSELQSRFDL